MNEFQNIESAEPSVGGENNAVESGSSRVGARSKVLKIFKSKIVIIIIALLILAGVAFYFRGLFVAATVNGKIISRWSVIRELEKGSGKQVLDSIVTQKLIDWELNKSQVEVSDQEVGKEIETIKSRLALQGTTLAAALAAQGVPEQQLKDRILVQKKLEKLLADKTSVTDEEVGKYIKENKLSPPKGVKAEDFKAQIKEQLRSNKFNQEAQLWVADLKDKADIKYFVKF